MAIHSPNQLKEIRGLSLCAGVAGLDLGLHIAEPNYRTVCYVERNSFAAASIVARMADTSLAQAPIWDDLKSFDGKPWRGKIHILSAGYPCQPFTLSGSRKGADDPRHLWPDVARIVKEVEPECVFFENVPGHLSLGLQDVTNDLQAMGFTVAACVVSAAEVGATHTRERVFILGYTNIQGQRKPSVCSSEPVRDGNIERSKPDRITDRFEEPSISVDIIMGLASSGGLEGNKLSIFPPKQDNIAEWRKTLKRRPELKPCLHRLDDGMACGVDRSAAAGNGVVSLAAANAWIALNRELRGY